MADVTSINQIVITAKDETGAAFTSAAAGVKKVGADVDGLNGRLRELQVGFGDLQSALKAGRFAGGEGITDELYKQINAEIANTKTLLAQVSSAATDGLGKASGQAEGLRLATAGVTREFIVLGHEVLVGNFSRIPGSILVLLERMGNLTALLSGAGALFGAAAAGVGLFLFAMVKGAEETTEMNQAIAKSGDFAGVTRGQMLALANQVSATGSITVGAAKDIVTQLVASGKIGADAIGTVAGLAAEYSRQTGADITKVGGDLVKLFSDPTKGARELIESFGGVTVAQEEYIRHLQQQGEVGQAQLALADALKGKLEAQQAPLGTLQRLWEGVKGAASAAWDAMLGIGRTKTPEEAYAEARQQSANVQAGLPGVGTDFGTALGNLLGGPSPAAVAAAKDAEQVAKDTLDLTRLGAQAEADKTAATREGLAVQDLINKSYKGQIADLDDQIVRIKQSAQYQAGDAAARQAVVQDQKQIASIYRAMDADHRAAVEGDLQAQIKVADVAVQSAEAQNDAALKLGQITQAEHDRRLTNLQLEKNANQQNYEAQILAIGSLDAKERASHLANLTALVAERSAIEQQGENKQLEDMQALDTIIAKIHGELPGFASDFLALQKGLADAYAEGKLGIVGSFEALQKYADLTNQLLAQQPFAVRWREAQAAIEKASGAYQTFVGKIQDGLDKQKQAIDNLGKMPDQIARANAELQVQQEIDKELNDLATQYAVALGKNPALAAQLLVEINSLLDSQGRLVTSAGDLADAYAKAKRELDDWKSILSGIADEGAKFIEDFVQHGSSAFKNLWNDFKTMALEAFAKIAAQKIIVTIAAAFGGTAAAAANQLFGLGGSQSNPILNLLLGGGRGVGGASTDLAGSFATSSVGQTLGLSTPVGGVGGIAADSVGAVPGGAAADLALTGSGSFLASAASYLPFVALAIPLLTSLFGGSSHGPKTQGSFFGDFDTSGTLKGPVSGGMDLLGITGDNQQSAQAQQFAQGLATSFYKTLQQIGGTSGGLQFGTAFSTDPNGTAQSHVTTQVRDSGGNTILAQNNEDVGRDDASLQAEIALQAQRAVLAALEASDLPAGVAKLFDAVDVTAATTDQITAVETLAATYKGLSAQLQDTLTGAFDGTTATSAKLVAIATIVSQFGDSITGLGPKIESLDATQITAFVDALGGAQQAVATMQFINDNFTTSADKASAAQALLTTDFANLGQQVPKDHQAFLDLLNSFLDGTDAGNQMYASVAALAPLFVQVAGTADQAAAALKQQVQAGIDAYNQHFLTPEEQTAGRVSVDETALFNATKQGTLLNTVLTDMGLSVIPSTVAGVRAWHDAVIAAYGPTSAEAQAMEAAIPQIFDLIDATGGFSNAMSDAATVAVQAASDIERAWTQIDEQLSNFATTLGNLGSLAGQAKDFGTQLSDAVLLYGDQVTKTQAKIAAALANPTALNQSNVQYIFTPELAEAKKALAAAQAELTEFNTLSAQYGADKAAQLVQLEIEHKKEQQVYAGDAAALAIINDRFHASWNDIINATQTAVTAVQQSIEDFIKSIEQVAQATQGNAGQRFGIDLALGTAKQNSLTTQLATTDPTSAAFKTISADLATITAYNHVVAGYIADFAIYTAQYGADIASQLVDLEKWRDDQKKILTDLLVNDPTQLANALGILGDVVDDKWQKIIDGTTSGVNSTIDAMQKIADYLKGLVVSDISPLTARQKLDTARASLDAEIALAQPTNTDAASRAKALGDVTQYLDTFLALDRDFNKSNDTFAADFNNYTSILGNLAGVQSNGQPVDATTAIAAALPVGSPLASSADIATSTQATQSLEETVKELIAALADSNTADAEMLAAAALKAAQTTAADTTASAAK